MFRRFGENIACVHTSYGSRRYGIDLINCCAQEAGKDCLGFNSLTYWCSMNVTRPIQIDAETIIFVEVEKLSSEEEADFAKIAFSKRRPNVPLRADAVETSKLTDRITGTADSLRDSLRGVLKVVHAAMQDHEPDEWGVEVTIGFKGTANPIPVFVSGEANAALKVHAKWKKPTVVEE